MASLELCGIKKSFGPVAVLHDLDLAIQHGEFLVLLGPSGCGKSTLLRIVAGLEDADAGDILVGGRRVNALEPGDRNVAMVFQSYALYPHMNVAENIGFALRMAKMPRPEMTSRVAAAAKVLGLTDLLKRLPKELSGGQRQRVAMGRALVRETELFLFDEPLSNLDAKLRVQMRAEIRALHNRLGVTSIYVTHDQMEAMTLADRIVVMRDGKIEQVGSPFEVYDQPANVFVAQFLGSPTMNLLSASLGDRQALVEPGVQVELPLGFTSTLGLGDSIHYGVRPQDLMLTEAKGIPCRVSTVESTGSETLLYCTYGQNDQAICAAVSGRVAHQAGDRVHLQPQIDRVCIFDAATGMRL
jgi:multiple sugar transport system ATP-binding protein